MANLAAAAAGAALAFALIACSGTGASAPPDATQGDTSLASASAVVVGASEAVELLDERDDLVIIDVRTPEEFAGGHLAGAKLIDVQDPSFRAKVEALDRDVAYVVYCRAGNRSAVAVDIMQELGFVELYDAGGFADLAAAGADVES